MIRAAFLALAVAALPVLAQTKKPPTQSAPPKTAPTKTGTAKPTTKTGVTKAATTKRAAPPRLKTTLSGVYTLDEASAGKDIYSALCSTCHLTANQHNTADFRKKWSGRPLSELFTYMRTLMPKNDPGSLADEDYGVVLAYMLQMNRMPAGKAYLSTDTLDLRKIRFDTVRSVKKP